MHPTIRMISRVYSMTTWYSKCLQTAVHLVINILQGYNRACSSATKIKSLCEACGVACPRSLSKRYKLATDDPTSIEVVICAQVCK